MRRSDVCAQHVTEPPVTRSADDAARFARALRLCAGFVIVLWLIKVVESLSGADFAVYGNYPRRPDALGGIVLGPLIHGSWTHLLSNTAPLIVLGTAIVYGYPRASRIALPVIYFGGGIGVWLFARSAFHVGASGLTFGMMFFVFTIGALRWDRRAIALALMVFFLYGGMIWGIFPRDPAISFEAHLFGAVTGVALAVALRRLDPPPPERRYSWEDEEDEATWP